MTVRTKTELKQQVNSLLATNQTGEITAADIRSVFVDVIDSMAPSASPSLSGTPTAPTPESGAGDEQIATKKYVDDNTAGGTKAANADVDAVTATGTALSTSLADPSALDDSDYLSVRKAVRMLARMLKTASTTLRGVVLLARAEDLAATETDTSRVPTIAGVKTLISRLAGGRTNLLGSAVTISSAFSATALQLTVDDIDDHEYLTITGWVHTDQTPRYSINWTIERSQIAVDNNPTFADQTPALIFGDSLSTLSELAIGRNSAGTTLYLLCSNSTLDTGRISAVFGGSF